MAEYISFQPKDFFSPTLYTGTGAELTVTGIDFQPDFTWLKDRSAVQHHQVYDSVRGAGKVIYPNLDNAEGTVTQQLKSWTSDGYVIGTDGSANTDTNLYASWNFKAGTAFSGATTGSGTLKTYTASVSTTSGISITKYIGNGTSDHRIPHNLGAVPKIVIVKKLNASAGWVVMGTNMLTSSNYYLSLETTAAQDDGAGTVFYSWPSSTYFGIGAAGTTNTNDGDYIAYSFAPIKGYSSFGKYTGNNSSDGYFLYTGFRPAYVMIKKISDTGNWNIFDSKRLGYNVDNNVLSANTSEQEWSDDRLDIVSNGIKFRSNWDGVNDASDFIYMAFAENPIVSSNDVPTVAR